MWAGKSEDIILPTALGKAWGSETSLRNLIRVVSLEDPRTTPVQGQAGWRSSRVGGGVEVQELSTVEAGTFYQ